MLTVETHLDLEDVIDGFNGMKRRARNLMPVWRKLEPFLKKDQQENFRLRAQPEGGRWPAHSASYRERRRRTGRRLPRMLGRLRTQFIIQMGPVFIRARSRVAWSLAHQEGGRVGRGARLPRRTYHWMSNKFLDMADAAIAEYLAEAY
jgi:phage gpG-like protein